MRHAKAEPFAATDHDRELTDRGMREARAAGEALLSTGRLPDHVVVSTSRRTRATWEVMAETLDCDAEVVDDPAVYSGSEDVLLERLRAVPEDARTVLFVGHQPTVGYVAHLLDDGAGDPEALRRMLHGFTPGSYAVFEIGCGWGALGPETGRLVDFHSGQQ